MNDQIRIELVAKLTGELGGVSDTPFGHELLHYVIKFCETEDFNWIDLMVWRLTMQGLPMPMTIQKMAGNLAHRRLLGAGSRNQISKVLREHAQELAMTQMAYLLRTTSGPAEAAQKAATAVHAICGWAPQASTIEKRFPEYRRKTPVINALIGAGVGEAEMLPKQRAELEGELHALPQREPGQRR